MAHIEIISGTDTQEPIDLNARLLAIAAKIVEVSDGQIRLAHNEEDATSDAQPEAAHFLKLREKRLGRDIELYGFLGRIANDGTTVALFLEEVALPLRSTLTPDSYATVMSDVEQLGTEVYAPEMHEAWRAIFTD